MRIVLVNWARIWDGAGHGGGVNGYCQSLALALLERGHDVVSLFGGVTYTPGDARCVIRRHDDWLNVRVYEVVNSPVLAPSITQFEDPLGEVASFELEAEVSRFFAGLRPDVVHFHNIEGFSVGCVDAAKAAGARTIFSLHNYHTICPQVYLMQKHRVPCYDFENGHACATCIETAPPAVERAQRVKKYPLASQGPTAREELRGAIGEVRASLSVFTRPLKAGAAALGAYGRAMSTDEKAEGAVPLPGHECTFEGALPVSGPDARGNTAQLLGEKPGPPRDPDAPERRPLLNIATGEPPCEKPLNDFGKRRAAMVAMLNRCDHVLAVSDFVRLKFEAMGVRKEVIRTQHIGSRINLIVKLAEGVSFDPPPFAGTSEGCEARPVRIVFMGYNHYYKGLHMLAESLEALSADELRRVDLSIYALDGQSIEWVFRRMEPRLARLTFVCGYRYHDIPWMLGGKDLGIVCSVWWDNAPQTVFEFFACRVPVLGAELGGIPDFVRHGTNGLLFRGNDRADLTKRLREVIADPKMLDVLRRNITPPKDIGANAAELEGLYQGA